MKANVNTQQTVAWGCEVGFTLYVQNERLLQKQERGGSTEPMAAHFECIVLSGENSETGALLTSKRHAILIKSGDFLSGSVLKPFFSKIGHLEFIKLDMNNNLHGR
ncbi:unnamed protein product [Caretta caretta]